MYGSCSVVHAEQVWYAHVCMHVNPKPGVDSEVRKNRMAWRQLSTHFRKDWLLLICLNEKQVGRSMPDRSGAKSAYCHGFELHTSWSDRWHCAGDQERNFYHMPSEFGDSTLYNDQELEMSWAKLTWNEIINNKMATLFYSPAFCRYRLVHHSGKISPWRNARLRRQPAACIFILAGVRC